ncbi:MAG: hypothetical protein EGQ21_18135 [Akkermansia sp.]|nr:hypothetical protein [Akkermansia sp.]
MNGLIHFLVNNLGETSKRSCSCSNSGFICIRDAARHVRDNIFQSADSLPASSNNPFILSSYKKFMTKTVSKAEGKRSFQEPAAYRNMEP